MKFISLPQMENRCKQYGKLFVHKRNLIRHHLHAHVAGKNYSCNKCDKKFHREYNKLLHENHCNKIEHYHSNSLKRKLTSPVKKQEVTIAFSLQKLHLRMLQLHIPLNTEIMKTLSSRK